MAMMIPRGLDHVVHAVRDLDRGAGLYRRLGFTVGGRNRHAWGTQNHIVQLPGFFVEVLSLTEPDRLGDDGLSKHFGRFQQSYLARREGLSTLVVESADIARDAAELAREKIASSDVLTFRRAADPAGPAGEVGFSLAFARDSLSPEASFALCQQHDPDRFWTAALQVHENGAARIAGIDMVADNPTDHHAFVSKLVGVRDIHSTSAGLRIDTPRGDIRVLTPVAFTYDYGVEWTGIGEGAFLAALRFAVRDLDRVRSLLDHAGLSPLVRREGLVVPPDRGMGATIVFAAEAGA